MEPYDSTSNSVGAGGSSASSITVRIVRTEEQISVLMQRFTAYVIEVCDFGRTSEVAHRYGDFETLYKSIMVECPGVNLPNMPAKGVDGTDMAVVAKRKVDLEKILRAMLSSPEVLVEKQLQIWKFLNLENPAVIAGRFALIPRIRPQVLKTLVKLNEPKYKDDVFRLGHQSITDLLLEALREFRNGQAESKHWCRQDEGRKSVCQLLAGALGASEAARARLIEADVIGTLVGIVEREESALDDARTALNVIVAREAERFGSLLAAFLCRGGMSQLYVLAQRVKCQEFVAKLLWLAWDAPARAPFAQPGGQGLRLLQALLRSSTATCSLLGAVLLAGLLANGDLGSDPDHRVEVLKMVRPVLQNPEAASDPQFTKTLCGANASLVRLASLLEDGDLAPLVLGLLCSARPPAAKLGRIAGNLASMVGDRGSGVHSEETRARAAELLLHIQAQGSTASAPGTSTIATPSASTVDLERCEGIAEHEESLDKAMRWQLDEALGKSRQALDNRAGDVQEVAALGQHRLQDLPALDFASFNGALARYKDSRETLGKYVRESQGLQHDMERQLLELKTAKPSSVDEQQYKERLVGAERLYMEAKTQRETLTAADADLKQAQAKSEASSSQLKRVTDEVRKLDEEISSLRLRKAEKETEATKLRHKANTPNLQQMKEQAEASLERNAAQAKELQMIGQRVQQGDPDYLKAGETRESKISELANKLGQLKKQHQELLRQQKEFDFNPVELNNQAAAYLNEATELQNQMSAMEARRLDVDRDRSEKTSQASRDADEARIAQERRSSASSRLQSAESQVRSELSALQPMIQEHHAGWQRLLGQQKKLESDSNALGVRLADARRAAEAEASSRADVALHLQGLILSLQSCQLFLEQINIEPAGRSSAQAQVPAVTASSSARTPNLFADDEDDLLAVPPSLVEAPVQAPTQPPSAASLGLLQDDLTKNIVDDFDAFLQEDTDITFGANVGSTTEAPRTETTTSVFEDDDILAEGFPEPTGSSEAPALTPEPATSNVEAVEAPPALVPAAMDDGFDEL